MAKRVAAAKFHVGSRVDRLCYEVCLIGNVHAEEICWNTISTET